MSRRERKVLVLYRMNTPMRLATRDHLHALDYARSPLRVLYYNALDGVPERLRHVSFDAVVFHTTFLGMRWSDRFPIWKWNTRWLNELDCPKLALPQDEYDHSEILDEWLQELGATDVFSVFDEPHWPVLYPLTHRRVRFHHCLTGYIDEETARRYEARLTPARERPYDIVYRAARLPFWFGSHGQLKHRLGEAVAEAAPRHRLATDISTRHEDAITGEEWLDFLVSGRAVVGAESGSSALDRRGEIAARITRLVAEDPLRSFESVSARLPSGWDDYAFFALSPRHLEAVVTKTAQILVEGRYDGILERGRHYLPLARDLSNLDEVLERARDGTLLERLAEQAYEEVYRSGAVTYRHFAAQLEDAIDTAAPRRPTRRGEAIWRATEASVRAEEAISAHMPRTFTRFRESPRNTVVKGLTTLRLTLSVPEARRLLFAYVRSRRARHAAGSHALLADLLRLGALRGKADKFQLIPLLDEARGKLVLLARPRGDNANPQPTPIEEVEAALRSGRVTSIVWDHSAVGSELAVELERGQKLDLGVGINNMHQFEALEALAPSFPEATAAAIAAVLRSRSDF